MKTTIKQLVAEINLDNKQLKTSPGWEYISQALDVEYLDWSNDERLTKHFIKPHYCTDTWVGMSAYFLDGEFVAISDQSGRKSDEFFNFISKEKATLVREYLISLIEGEKDEPTFDLLSDEDLNQEFDDTYKVEYNSQILHKSAIYLGDKVAIKRTRYPYDAKNSNDYFHTVEIERTDGRHEEVDVKHLELKYNSLD